MKLILIGLALLQIAPELNAQRGGVTTVFYEELNYRRGKKAGELEIANMNFINYDEDLEDVLIEEVEKYDGCPDAMSVRKRGLEFYLNSGQNIEMQKELVTKPGPTRVASFSSECEGKKIFNFVLDYSSSPAIHGTPASQCPKGSTPGERDGPMSNLCFIPFKSVDETGPNIHHSQEYKYARKSMNNRMDIVKSVVDPYDGLPPCPPSPKVDLSLSELLDWVKNKYQRKTAIGPEEYYREPYRGCRPNEPRNPWIVN
ncbi:hypothetical protein GCK72_020050 [Caenorhabditis remanei]|uniref:Uncharacterized protein n=1 Tax=Caenorhabditis remanei TaxID=31234 RepID=A0A6A5GFP6_CAERE|nr:hypothetical protein GCK72_020050 [Caenorhabditis remanei]KAF1753493.1 hypothetical protein GCK72_020050 [Caenorhabditis remanei]